MRIVRSTGQGHRLDPAYPQGQHRSFVLEPPELSSPATTRAFKGPSEGLKLCVTRLTHCSASFKRCEHDHLRVLLHNRGVAEPSVLGRLAESSFARNAFGMAATQGVESALECVNAIRDGPATVETPVGVERAHGPHPARGRDLRVSRS